MAKHMSDHVCLDVRDDINTTRHRNGVEIPADSTGIQRGSGADRNIRRAILLAMRVLGLKSVDERYSMDLISEVCFALNLINNQN